MAKGTIIRVRYDDKIFRQVRNAWRHKFSHKHNVPLLKFINLNASHAQAMHRLESACFSLPWTLEQCAGALRQKNFSACGFMDADELTAYLSFYHAADEMEIVNLAVLPAHRRKGLAKRLLGIVLQASRKMGIQKVLLEVRATNFAAISLYEQCGFRQNGARSAYYPDTGEDALIYVCGIHDFNHLNS